MYANVSYDRILTLLAWLKVWDPVGRAGQKDFQKDFLLCLLLLLFHLLLISIFCAFDGARTLIDWLQIWWDGVHRQFEESLNFQRFFFALFVPPVLVQVSSFDFHFLLCPPFWISCFFR